MFRVWGLGFSCHGFGVSDLRVASQGIQALNPGLGLQQTNMEPHRGGGRAHGISEGV